METEASATELSALLEQGKITSLALLEQYLARIEAHNPKLHAVLELAADAREQAARLDAERAQGQGRSALHGLPILLKDNLDTADTLHTSAGSLALAEHRASADSEVARRLRAAGLLILGKANMTEWANFMTTGMPNGYSSRGGQTVNPYNPQVHTGGSSSGSAVAVAADLAPLAIGTETSGSILSPASQNCLVGVKPTVGLVSRRGIIPISHSQDTAGPIAKTVRDAAALLSVIAGPDPADPATARALEGTDFTSALRADALPGVRFGLVRGVLARLSEDERSVYLGAVETLKGLGAEVIEVDFQDPGALHSGFEVLVYEFKPGLNRYLAGTEGPRSIAELMAFGDADPERRLRYGQVLLQAAQGTRGDLSEGGYRYARARDLRICKEQGIDALLYGQQLEALLFPQNWGAGVAAKAGYPSVTVPAGMGANGVSVNLTFTGDAYSEMRLLQLAYAFEQATRVRRPPAL